MSDREELVSEAAKAAAKLLAKKPNKRTADVATNGPLMLQNKRTLTQQSLPAHIQQLQTDHNASLVRALTSFYPPEALAEAAQQFEQSVTGSQLSSLHYSFSPQLIQEAAIAAAQASQAGQNPQRQSPSPNNPNPHASSSDSDNDKKEAESSSIQKTQTLRHKCDQCQQRFSRLYNLKSHMQTHKSDRPFICPTCPKAFARKHDLTRHMKSHSDAKAYTCEICERGFIRKDALRRHLKLDGQGKIVDCAGLREGAKKKN